MGDINTNNILLGNVSSEVQKLLCSIQNYIRTTMNPEGYIAVILTSQFRTGWHKDEGNNQEKVNVNLAVSLSGPSTLFYDNKYGNERAVKLADPEDIKAPSVEEAAIWLRVDNGALHSAPNKPDEEFHTPRLVVIYSFKIDAKISGKHIYNNSLPQEALLHDPFFEKDDKILDELNTYVESTSNIKPIKNENLVIDRSGEWGTCRRDFTGHTLVNSKNDSMFDSSNIIVETLISGASTALQIGYGLAEYAYDQMMGESSESVEYSI
jgi:hypothetical protein